MNCYFSVKLNVTKFWLEGIPIGSPMHLRDPSESLGRKAFAHTEETIQADSFLQVWSPVNKMNILGWIVNNNQGIKMFAKLKKKICKPFLFQPLFCPSHCLRILYKKNVRSTLYRIFDKSYSYTRPAIIAAWARVNVSVSPHHLSVSPRHLSVSPRHLSASPRHLSVSPHHLSVSPRHLFVSPRHLSISSRHFGFLALRTPVGRLWTSARHFSRRPMATWKETVWVNTIMIM